MSPKQLTPSANFDLISAEMPPGTPATVIELVARQVDRANEAKIRIDKEGGVVRDLKGNVIPHPAIAIEQQATKLIAEILLKYKKAPTAKKRPRAKSY